MFKILAVALLLFTPTAFAGKHVEKNRAPASLAKCRDAKCPLNMIHCEEGTHRVDVRAPGSCCPRWKCEEDKEAQDCRMAKCPKRFVQCKPGEKKVDRRSEGACCPNFKCEKPGRVSDAACPPVAPPKCDEQTQVLVNKAAEGECPNWECMDDESEEL